MVFSVGCFFLFFMVKRGEGAFLLRFVGGNRGGEKGSEWASCVLGMQYELMGMDWGVRWVIDGYGWEADVGESVLIR